jgi:hypothetical protein
VYLSRIISIKSTRVADGRADTREENDDAMPDKPNPGLLFIRISGESQFETWLLFVGSQRQREGGEGFSTRETV